MSTDKSKNGQQLEAKKDIDQFLEKIAATEVQKSEAKDQSGRLIFSLDATASRQHTWDQAMQLQGDMFVKTRGLRELEVQLVYYRGFAECRASPWLQGSASLLKMMQKVNCHAGTTQIERLLRHAIAETKKQPVQAMVFVGDCMEENIDRLGNLAGQLNMLGLPVFIFQEGRDPSASYAFNQIATLSGGAHCQFDHSAANRLGELLNAVAVYAAGGKAALERLAGPSHGGASLLLKQIK